MTAQSSKDHQGPPSPPKKVRKLCSLIKMSSPPLRPQIGSSQAATRTHSQTAYLERLRGRDADAPDADPCASLWAYSSLRSRYTGQPAPWRWCCQSYCRRVTQWKQNEAAGVPLLLYAYMKVLFQIHPENSAPIRLCAFCRVPACSLCPPLQSAAPVCRLPLCAGSDLSGHGLLSGGGGRCNNERDYPRRRGAGRLLRNKDHSYVMLLCLAFASFICLFACLFLCLKKNCSKITFHHADYQT